MVQWSTGRPDFFSTLVAWSLFSRTSFNKSSNLFLQLQMFVSTHHKQLTILPHPHLHGTSQVVDDVDILQLTELAQLEVSSIPRLDQLATTFLSAVEDQLALSTSRTGNDYSRNILFCVCKRFRGMFERYIHLCKDAICWLANLTIITNWTLLYFEPPHEATQDLSWTL